MAVSLTPNYGFKMHDAGDLNWDVSMNENMWSIDSWISTWARIIDENHAYGDTASRPVWPATHVGTMYFDETLGIPIWCRSVNPEVWVDSAGTVV